MRLGGARFSVGQKPAQLGHILIDLRAIVAAPLGLELRIGRRRRRDIGRGKCGHGGRRRRAGVEVSVMIKFPS